MDALWAALIGALVGASTTLIGNLVFENYHATRELKRIALENQLQRVYTPLYEKIVIGADFFPGQAFVDMSDKEFAEYLTAGLRIVIPNLQYASKDLIDRVSLLREITVEVVGSGPQGDSVTLESEARWLNKHAESKFFDIRAKLKIK